MSGSPKKPWSELSEDALAVMKTLGNFGPVTRGGEIKGYTLDADGEPGKTYYDASDLEKIAAACTEVAQWLRQ